MILIVLACVFIDVLLHNLPIKKTVANLEYSNIVKIVSFPVAATIFLIISFGILTIFFIKNQKYIYGTRVKKGFSFGIAISLIWMLGILETSPITGSSLIEEVFPALSDGIPIIIMGLLLGRFVGSDSNIQENKFRKGEMLYLTILAIFFVIGRYFAYGVLGIDSGYLIRPWLTFIWTLSMGICMVVVYMLLAQNSENNKSLIKHSLWYGGGMIGLNWLVFNLFMPLIFNVRLSDILIRCSSDAVFITLGIIIANYLRKLKYNKQ